MQFSVSGGTLDLLYYSIWFPAGGFFASKGHVNPSRSSGSPFEAKTISRFLLVRYYVRGWSPTVLMRGVGLVEIQCDGVLHGSILGQRFVGPDEIVNQAPRLH